LTLGPTKILGQTIVSEADYTAAWALANPELAYPAMPLPSPAPAVSAGTSTVPAPYADTEEYAAAVDAAIAEGAAQTKAAVQSYFGSTAANLDAVAAGGDGSPQNGGSWLTWLIVGGLVLVGLSVSGGRRR
jgi:hypothetical protein